jgi:ABC-2 type transport system ATP-binding protein
MLLSVRDLRVDYPGLIAVDDLTFDVEPGDGFALIGPNGAGKTSTFRSIAGLLEPTRGQIQIAGVDMEKDPRGYRRLLGYMPDDAPVIARLTCAEFLDHFGRAYEIANRAARVEECLVLTGLIDKASSECRTLSRGMRQRLVVARTLLHDPTVLVLDEPASGLDPIARMELRKVLNDLRAAGKAIVVSSHILTEIAEFCNKVGILERGVMRVSGPVETLAAELGSRSFRVRWRAAGESGDAILAAAPGVLVTEGRPDGANFDFHGTETSLDAVLGALVSSGVRVTEWRNASDDLEHVFMKLGAKEIR